MGNFAKSREVQQQFKANVISHYSEGTMKCQWCSFGDMRALSIDHINGGGARHIKQVGNLYTWLIKNGYPDGFQVLCMNCQWIKRAQRNETAKKHPLPHRYTKRLNEPLFTKEYWNSPEGCQNLETIREIQLILASTLQ